MNLGALAHDVTAFLVPLLPYLEKAGERATREVAHNMSEDISAGAKELWGRISPRIISKEGGREAVAKVIERPTDLRAHGTLELQIEDLLAHDASFATEIAGMLEAAGPRASWAHLMGNGAIAQGNGAVAAGKDGVAAGRDVVFGGPVPVKNERLHEDE
jgi:hypothetical protein